MAKTRLQIRQAVHLNTGRGVEKADLINSLCDEALKLAVNTNAFRDSIETYNITLVEDAVSQSLSVVTPTLVHVVTALLLQVGGDSYRKLTMKDKIWWDRSIIDASRNQKGWPLYCYRDTSTLYFDRPLEASLQLRILVSREMSFTDDTTVCPIAVLDNFITHYVTALVFLSLENMESYSYWKSMALGAKWDEGIVGGSLKHAISSDSYDLAEEFKAEVDNSDNGASGGISILNNDTEHDDFGNIRTWY